MAFSSAYFGVGVGPIHLDNVDCTGSERKLIECPNNIFVRCTNGHSEDAGVRCQGILILLIKKQHSIFTYLFIWQSIMPVATVLMVMFVWWEAPISMRVEWRCASMSSGEQCVIPPGTALMLLWSASSWDMDTLEVSTVAQII